MAMQDLSGEEVMRLIEARERRKADKRSQNAVLYGTPEEIEAQNRLGSQKAFLRGTPEEIEAQKRLGLQKAFLRGTPEEIKAQNAAGLSLLEEDASLAPTGTPSAALINALVSLGVGPQKTETANTKSERSERQPLIAPPAPELPMGAMTPEEGRALAEFQTAQGRAVNVESVLPFLRAGQQITQAWTGAPVDVQGLEAIQQTARRPSEEAAQRFALAREFAKRRMEGEKLGLELGAKKAQTAAELRMKAAELQSKQENEAFNQAVKARELEQKDIELNIKARQAARERDPLARRRLELEVEKGERELAALQSGRMTPEQEAKALQLQKLRKEVSGEETPAEQRKKREAIVEIRERGANIDRNLRELEKLVQEEGTYNVVGPQNKLLKDKLYQVAIDIAKLMDPGSVAREGEVNAIMKFSLFEPSPFMRDTTAIELIQNLRKGMNARLQEAYRVRGIAPDVAEGTRLSPEKQKRLEELRAKQQRGE